MADYTFTKIADTSTGTFADFSRPSINDSGTVTFSADLESGSDGIYVGDGTIAPTLVVDESGFLDNPSLPSINNDGVVAFRSELDEGGEGIFTADVDMTSVTTIADSSGPLASFGDPDINDDGTVAFNAFWDGDELLDPSRVNANEGIFISEDGLISSIAESSGPYQLFTSPSINDEGTVAFWSFLDEGYSGIYTGGASEPIAAIADTEDSFVDLTGDDNQTNTEDRDPGAFYTFDSYVENAPDSPIDFIELVNVSPDINDDGEAVFVGRQGSNDSLYVSDGTSLTKVADTSGPFNFFTGGDFINDNGEVAFTAGTDDLADLAIDLGLTGSSPVGIYVGSNPETDEVISIGDELFGSTVIGLVSGGLNNSGQIPFLAELEDGTIGIFRADPIGYGINNGNVGLI